MANKPKKVYPRVSEKQLKFLEYIIWRSHDAREISKQCVIWLIRQSEGLSKPVGLIIKDPTLAKLVGNDFHDMGSAPLTTHVCELFHLAGSEFSLSYGRLAIIDFEAPSEEVTQLCPSLDELQVVFPSNPYGRAGTKPPQQPD